MVYCRVLLKSTGLSECLVTQVTGDSGNLLRHPYRLRKGVPPEVQGSRGEGLGRAREEEVGTVSNTDTNPPVLQVYRHLYDLPLPPTDRGATRQDPAAGQCLSWNTHQVQCALCTVYMKTK